MAEESQDRVELFSERVSAGSRTYFLDVKESSEGSIYLVISESRQSGESREKHRVMVFEDNILAFNRALKKAVKFMVDKSIE